MSVRSRAQEPARSRLRQGIEIEGARWCVGERPFGKPTAAEVLGMMANSMLNLGRAEAPRRQLHTVSEFVKRPSSLALRFRSRALPRDIRPCSFPLPLNEYRILEA